MTDDRVLPSLAKSTNEYMSALELMEDGFLEEAEKHARKSLQIKKNIDAYLLLIDILEKQGKDSSEFKKTLLEEYPANPETYRRLFLSDFKSNKEDALSNINKAINLMRKGIYYYDKARLLFSMERFIESLASIDQAIKIENKNPLYWTQRAKTLIKLDRTSDGKESCDVALKIEPLYRDALILSAKIYLDAGEKERAREAILKIQDRDEEAVKLLEKTMV